MRCNSGPAVNRKPVRPALGDDDLAGEALVCAEVPAQRGDEGLDRCRIVSRQALAPQVLGNVIDGNRTSPSGQQDLEYLLGPATAEVTRPQRPPFDLDRDRPEQSNFDAIPIARHVHAS